MGRHTHPNGNIRGNLMADREVRRAFRGHNTPPFGIRRTLTEDDAESVMGVTFPMQEAGDIPFKVTLRDRLAVTLLSQRVIGAQMMRGFVAAHSLDKARHTIATSEGCNGWRESVQAERGSVEIYNGRTIFAKIISPEVEAEIDEIHEALGRVGLKSISKKEKPFVPHMTLGETSKGNRLSNTEQRHVKHMLEDTLPFVLELEEWDVYPDDVFEPNR